MLHKVCMHVVWWCWIRVVPTVDCTWLRNTHMCLRHGTWDMPRWGSSGTKSCLTFDRGVENTIRDRIWAALDMAHLLVRWVFSCSGKWPFAQYHFWKNIFFKNVTDPQNTKTPRIWTALVERISFLSSDLDKSAHNKSYSMSPKGKNLPGLKG